MSHKNSTNKHKNPRKLSVKGGPENYSKPKDSSRNSIKKNNSRKTTSRKYLFISRVLLFLIIIFIIVAMIVKITESLNASNFNKGNGDLPMLNISLRDDLVIEEIDINSKDISYSGNSLTLVTNNSNESYGDIEIKGRGNSTWSNPKKPYQIKFKEKTSLFGLNSARKWILLADYLDETHLRNHTAFYIQHLLESNAPINDEYVELYIDNNYHGLYLLTEKVEINKNRINLNDSLGVIMELSNLHIALSDCAIISLNGNCFTIHDSVNKDKTLESSTVFVEKFNKLELAIAEKDYTTVSKLIDIDSFAKYFLLSEFTNNPDSYTTSFFIFTDDREDKLHASVGWDYDLSLGNTNWNLSEIDQEKFLSPENFLTLKSFFSISPSKTGSYVTYNSYIDRTSTLIYDLLDFPEFSSRVKEIYSETLLPHKDDLLSFIEDSAASIRSSVLRDQERWKLPKKYDEEVDYLLNWLSRRYDFMNDAFTSSNSSNSASTETPSNSSFTNPPTQSSANASSISPEKHPL